MSQMLLARIIDFVSRRGAEEAESAEMLGAAIGSNLFR
jgi:hypothetical protein